MSFEFFFLFESREKKEAGSNTEHKKKRTEQIRVERKEIEHSADMPHYTEKRDFD
jgi:hypothetical protein